jgi:hypothetical protein
VGWVVANAGLYWTSGYVATGALILVVIRQLRGLRAPLGGLMLRSVARLPAVVVVGVAVALATYGPLVPGTLWTGGGEERGGWAAMVLGLVLGAWLACGTYVAVPACVVERRGPLRALRRSWWLTRGARWVVLVLLVLYQVGNYLVVATVNSLAFEVLGGFSPWPNIVATLLGTSVQAVLVAVAYHELRRAREGLDATELAAIFE